MQHGVGAPILWIRALRSMHPLHRVDTCTNQTNDSELVHQINIRLLHKLLLPRGCPNFVDNQMNYTSRAKTIGIWALRSMHPLLPRAVPQLCG